jgi:hypothetical protein
MVSLRATLGTLAGGALVMMNAPDKRDASPGRARHNRGHGVVTLAAG